MKVRWPRRTSLPKRGISADSDEGDAPAVSVIIPTYNRATLLPRAVESVLRQTFSDLELIVVDDGSTDATQSILDNYGDERLRAVRLPKNGGVARAMNRGILAARGRWVAFLGDDDEWLPVLLEQLTARLREDPSVSFVHSAATWILPPDLDAGELVSEPSALPEGDMLDHLLAGMAQLCASACLVKRDVLLAFGGFDETLRRGEDTDLWLRMALAGHRFGVVRERLAVVHYDHEIGEHLTLDPVLRAVALHQFHRRWRSVGRQRIGELYDTRYRRRLRRSRREQRKGLKAIGHDGNRWAAWRYARRMLPTLPWGVPYVAQAIMVGVFGRLPHRIRRRMKKLRRSARAGQRAR